MNLGEIIRNSTVNESDVIYNKQSLIRYLQDLITEFVYNNNDINKLSQLLSFLAGKTVEPYGNKQFLISEDDVKTAFESACKHGIYYCSTDKKMKCRKGPKQTRG